MNIANSKKADPVTPAEWNDKFVDTYFFCKFVVKDDTLTMWMMDAEVAAKAVDDGKLKGTVKRNKDQKVESVRLTDSTDNLAKYVEKAGNAAIFSDKAVFELKRVK